jgi:hypothetical protein
LQFGGTSLVYNDKKQKLKKPKKPVDIEYCASGFLGFSGAESMIKHGTNNNKMEYIDYIVDSVNYLKGMFDKVGIDMSVMYNAQYEQKNGYMMELLKQRGMTLEVHSDSGGLQIFSRGLDLEAEKPNIFKSQGTYSDLAMSFDLMPMVTVGDRAVGKSITFHKAKSNNYFVKELAYIRGKESAKNVIDQIEEFIKQGTHTKIMLILQGHHIEDYDEYARGLYEIIPEKYYDRIHGIALGATAYQRFDDLMDVYLRLQRDLKHVPKQHLKQVHLLGTGTIERTFSFMILANKDYYDFPFKFSFDASTHTSSSTWGKWTELRDDGKVTAIHLGGYKMTRHAHMHFANMWEEVGPIMTKHFPECKTVEDLIELFSPFNSEGKRLSADFEDKEEYVRRTNMYSYNCFILESATFLRIANDIINNRNYLSKSSNKYRKTASSMIDNLKNYDDYIAHEKEYRKIFAHLRPRKINYVNTLAEIDELQHNKENNVHDWNDWE